VSTQQPPRALAMDVLSSVRLQTERRAIKICVQHRSSAGRSVLQTDGPFSFLRLVAPLLISLCHAALSVASRGGASRPTS
jgi:hypothetical protein